MLPAIIVKDELLYVRGVELISFVLALDVEAGGRLHVHGVVAI